MNAQELRIGNILSHDENWNYAGHFGPFVWSERDWYALDECTLKLEDITPIPLTSEWLLKLGFKETDKFGWEFNLSIGAIKLKARESNGRIYFELESIYLGDSLRYVHQIQNLYHSLIGNDLVVH